MPPQLRAAVALGLACFKSEAQAVAPTAAAAQAVAPAAARRAGMAAAATTAAFGRMLPEVVSQCTAGNPCRAARPAASQPFKQFEDAAVDGASRGGWAANG